MFPIIRFTVFCKVLESKMRDAAKKGVEVKCRKVLHGEISVEEEELL